MAYARWRRRSGPDYRTEKRCSRCRDYGGIATKSTRYRFGAPKTLSNTHSKQHLERPQPRIALLEIAQFICLELAHQQFHLQQLSIEDLLVRG